MMIVREKDPCYILVCDRCGKGDNSEYGGSFHHPDEASARQSAHDLDWRQAEDGAWLCFDCFDEARGELPCPHGGRCSGACGADCPVPATAQKKKAA